MALSKEELAAGAERLGAMVNGFMPARVLLLGVELGLFDRLAQGAADAATLARELSLQQRGVEIAADALVALGLLKKIEGRYENTPLAEALLVRGRPGSQAHIMGHRAEMFRSWALLDSVVRAGPQQLEGQQKSLVDVEANRNFILGMAEVSHGRLGPILDRLPLAEAKRFVDVGGGPAQYCCEAVRRHPALRATLVDLPLTVEVAKGVIAEQGLTDRVDTIVCDFYREDVVDLGGAADVVLVSQVLHAEGPEQNAALLAKLAPQLAPGGSLVVVENMVDETRTAPAPGALFAVNMLAGTQRGRTYTAAEISGWLAAAGLEPEPVIEVAPRTQLLLARKA